jgi:SAM-dependent methyltransferase
MTTPATEVNTKEVLSFLQPLLPPAPANILEFGCGKGHVAKQLESLGYNVTAFDPSEKSIEQAKKNGVNATVQDLLTYETDTKFDVVIGVLVLHHIPEITKALEKIKSILKPGGLLLIDEFGRDMIDRASARWLFDFIDVLSSANVLVDRRKQHGHGHGGHHGHGHGHQHEHGHGHHEHGEQRQHGHQKQEQAEVSKDPLKIWENIFLHHQPPLHTSEIMTTEIKKAFPNVKISTRHPFLYRQIIAGIESLREKGSGQQDLQADAKLAETVLEKEKEAIAENRVLGIGLHYEARL